jgi:hypothetical protein
VIVVYPVGNETDPAGVIIIGFWNIPPDIILGKRYKKEN